MPGLLLVSLIFFYFLFLLFFVYVYASPSAELYLSLSPRLLIWCEHIDTVVACSAWHGFCCVFFFLLLLLQLYCSQNCLTCVDTPALHNYRAAYNYCTGVFL